MPDCLKPFTPQFKGSMRVKIVEDNDGYITLTGYPPNSFCNVHSIDNNDRPKVHVNLIICFLSIDCIITV